MEANNQNIVSLIAKVKEQLHIELQACEKGIYPNICKLRNTSNGEQEIFKNVFDIVSKTGMSIGSALAQYESSLI